MKRKSIEIIENSTYKPIRVCFVDENRNSYSPFKVILELENKDGTEK